jgi:hypothetical protein
LETPEEIGHLGEHELRDQHQISVEASNTRLAISAGTVLADQLLRCRVKGPLALLICQGLKGDEGLLAEAAVVAARPQLQLLVQGIG